MPPRPESAARRRIVETADRLFTLHGVRAVGVDRVVAEAGVAKMTLYHHFPAKDDLIVAALEHRDAEVFALFRGAVDAAPPGEQLRALFAAQREWFASPGFRGCALTNAAAALADPDHPGYRYVRDHKRRLRELLGRVVVDAGGGPGCVAAVALLFDGAVSAALISGSPDSADVACMAALKLISAPGV